MAARKQAEADFAKLCKRHNIWAHKWKDVMHCPNCRRPIFMTKHTDAGDKRSEEEQESIVDYLIFTTRGAAWVECKGVGGHTRLPLKEISQKQRNFLRGFEARGVPCWLFITLGDGRAPKGRKAWLIPWETWTFQEEDLFVHYDMKSVPWMATGRKADVFNMSGCFPSYEMEWNDGGWTIPESHPITYCIADLPELFE